MAEMTQLKKLGRPKKSEQNKEFKPIPLPELHRKVIIAPRDRNRNSAIVTHKGEVIEYTHDLMIILLDNIKRNISFTKHEIQNGIYKYEYVN